MRTEVIIVTEIKSETLARHADWEHDFALTYRRVG